MICELEKMELTGEIVYRTRIELAVRLISPIGKLSEQRTIPRFRAASENFDDEHGDVSACELLARAYRRAVLFDAHADRLRKLWRWTQALLIKLESEDPDAPTCLAQERREIRARLRAREIGDHENQLLLRPLSRRRKTYDDRRSWLLHQFEAARPWNWVIGLDEVVDFLGEDTTGLRDSDGLTFRRFDQAR